MSTKYDLPKDYISFSQVNTYLNCPENYKRKYIDQAEQELSSVPQLGRFVHAGVEALLQHKIDHGELPPVAFTQDWVSDHLEPYVKEVDVWESLASSPDQMEDRARAALKLYYANRAPDVRPIAVEQRLTIELDEGLTFLGYVDLIEEGSSRYGGTVGVETQNTCDKRVIDLKTTRRKYPKSRVRQSMQLSMYAHMVGCTSVGYDLIVQKKQPEFVPQRSRRSQRDIDQAIQVVKSVARAISMGAFPKTTPDTWLCSARYCQFYDDCYGHDTN